MFNELLYHQYFNNEYPLCGGGIWQKIVPYVFYHSKTCSLKYSVNKKINGSLHVNYILKATPTIDKIRAIILLN